MFEFDQDIIPTRMQLEKRYGVDMGVFPFGEKDNCCCEDGYPSDFLSHRIRYHKISTKEAMFELDTFMSQIFQKHKQDKDDLR